MLGILITVAVIAVVAYCVLKNYYPPIVLLLAGLLMLVCAWLMGVDPVDTSKALVPYRLAQLVICAAAFLIAGFVL